MIGSLINKLERRGHSVSINQATKSVDILDLFSISLFCRFLQSIPLNLVSTRPNTPSTGSVHIKLGFVPTSDTHNLLEFDEIFSELIKFSRPSLVSAPPVSLPIFSSFHIKMYCRHTAWALFAPTTTTRMMTTAGYPPMLAIQTTKESLLIPKKITFPSLNRSSTYKSLSNHLNL